MGFSCCIFHLTYWGFFLSKISFFFQCFHVRSNLFHAHIIILISCRRLFVSSMNLFHLISILFISFNTIRVIFNGDSYKVLNGVITVKFIIFWMIFYFESFMVFIIQHWDICICGYFIDWTFYQLYSFSGNILNSQVGLDCGRVEVHSSEIRGI